MSPTAPSAPSITRLHRYRILAPPPPFPNDRRHLASWTWGEPVQDEMEAYFGKPTKALKCKPPAACLATAVFVLVEGAAVASHPGTGQEEGGGGGMCGLLIFKPPVCQVSAAGMRPRTHTGAHAYPSSPPPSSSSACVLPPVWTEVGEVFRVSARKFGPGRATPDIRKLPVAVLRRPT